jgi:type II secretory ATPase GspE/PulE/Tfp pilus assembly ATPase PilB-like protein
MLSGLGRAMVQRGLLPERDAEAIQTQSKTAGVGFVEQLIPGKKFMETEIAEFAAKTFGLPLFDLAALDAEQIPLKITNGNAIDIAKRAQREGIRDLRQSGLLKVRQGMTSLEEVEACSNE